MHCHSFTCHPHSASFSILQDSLSLWAFCGNQASSQIIKVIIKNSELSWKKFKNIFNIKKPGQSVKIRIYSANYRLFGKFKNILNNCQCFERFNEFLKNLPTFWKITKLRTDRQNDRPTYRTYLLKLLHRSLKIWHIIHFTSCG